jgi:hypothetical protein
MTAMTPVATTGVAESGGQERGRATGLEAAVAHVGHALPVHEERVSTDPDGSVRMVLGVDREDPSGADDDVVDVGSVFPDRDGVQDLPPVAQPAQPGGD